MSTHELKPFGLLFFNGILIARASPSEGGGPRVVVSTAAFYARVRGSVPGLGGLKETKLFLPHPRVKVSIVGSLRVREVACSASDRQGSNFESCVWRTVSSQSSHHPQEVLLAQFSLCVHKGGLKPDSFHLSPSEIYFFSMYYIKPSSFRDIYNVFKQVSDQSACGSLDKIIQAGTSLFSSLIYFCNFKWMKNTHCHVTFIILVSRTVS